jgi:acetyl esterase/lipase
MITLLVLLAVLPAPRAVELWPQGAPSAKGTSAEDRPAVTPYLPAPGTGTGASMLVLPGGGFTRRCEDHEGVLVAEWLRAHGIAAFLVRYRVVPIGTLKDALGDVHRAVQTVRARSGEWSIAPDRIGAVGFSAGSFLAAQVAMRPLPAAASASDPVERVSSRPDFVVLAYGASSSGNPGVRGLGAQGLTSEEAATILSPTAEEVAAAPPVFFYGTTEDAGLTGNMSDLYLRLLKAGRRAEAHFFAYGEHGTGFALGDPVLGSWPELMRSWMRTNGLLTGAARVAVRGRVTIDGEPLPRGTVVLKPTGDESAPAVVAYVFGTSEKAGEFAVRAERGPTPGRYTVEVRQDATRWISNSRDPVQLRLQQKLRGGAALSADDVAEWTTSARAKDFSPSIEGQRVYTRRRPNDTAPIEVEIRPGAENRLDLEVASR